MLTLAAEALSEQPSLANLDLWIIGLYLAVLLGMGVVLEKVVKNSQDMFAAGGKSPWWLSGISAYMTMFSSGTFVVWGGIAYKGGIVAVSICTTLGFSALLVAFFLARRWKATGATSAAEYIGVRYGQGAVQVYTWLGIAARMVGAGVALYSIAVLVCALIPIPEALGGGFWADVQNFLRDPEGKLRVSIMVVVVGVVVVVISGNLWAVLITDTLQFIVLTVAVIMVVPLLMSHDAIGGLSGFIEKAGSLPAMFPDSNDTMQPAGDKTMLSPAAGEFTWLFLGGYIVIHMFKIGGEWAFVQRFLSVPKKSDATKVAVIFGVLYLVSPLIWMLPPMMYRMIEPIPVGMDAAAAKGVAEDAYILACQLALPAGMVGLMIAAMFSATVSMVDSEINVYAGALTRDVYAKLFGKQNQETHLVRVGKLLTVILGVVVISIALLIDAHGRGGAEDIILSITNLLVGPVTIPSLWVLFSRRVGIGAVYVTAVVGVGLAILYKFGGIGDLDFFKARNREAEVAIGVIPPLLILCVFEWFARGAHPNYARTRALQDQAEQAEVAISSEMPRKVIAWCCVALGVVMIGLVLVQPEARGYLIAGAAALLGVGAAMLLPSLFK